MEPKPTLTVERLRELLDYDPETGEFRWKVRGKGRRVGVSAGGRRDNGLHRIMIDGARFKAHHLAWFYVYGVWPTGILDHRNETPADNWISNLREATVTQNQQNRSRACSDSRTGLLGVSANGKGWQARIVVDGKTRCLGTYATPEEAHHAYLAAKRKLHPFWQGSDQERPPA